MAAPAAAQTIVVTPSNPQGWAPNSVNSGSVTGISIANPRGGDGSLQISGTQSGGVAIRTRFERTGTYGSLGDLSSFSFDWFRSSTSTVGGIQAPAFRLLVASTDPGAGGMRFSEFIWEYTYNGPGNAPVDSWQSVNTSPTSGVFWRSVSPSSTRGAQSADCSFNGGAAGAPAPAYQTLGAWLSGGCVGSNAQVYGVSVGIGSVPAVDGQRFFGHADNVGIQFTGQSQATVYNFEPSVGITAAPEPSTWALLGTGLLAVGGAAARRRRAAA